MSEERGDGEIVDSEAISLMSYTLRYVRLEDLDRHGERVASEALKIGGVEERLFVYYEVIK